MFPPSPFKYAQTFAAVTAIFVDPVLQFLFLGFGSALAARVELVNDLLHHVGSVEIFL